MLEKIEFQKFTAFEDLTVTLSPGINIFIGENGTGKTHILKAGYAACDIVKSRDGVVLEISRLAFAEKINRVFYPSGRRIGRLVKRSPGRRQGDLKVVRRFENGRLGSLRLSIPSHITAPEDTRVVSKAWNKQPIKTAYIPVKDMLANAPSFVALHKEREVHYEEVYADIISKASLPLLRGATGRQRTKLLEKLRKAMDGKVTIKNEEFFLKSKQGDLEFTLLAEGYRKLGLLWLLIQNGTLPEGSILFWDDPETNLNPKLMRAVVGVLIELQRLGVQILLSTHDYVILKEFDLQTNREDKLTFHGLYRNPESDEIEISACDEYLKIEHNAIDDTFGDLVDRRIKKFHGIHEK